MKYAVIGTGAIGGYYGGMLARSGAEVHFLAHSDYEEMRRQLRVDSCRGDFTLPRPNVYRSTADMPAVDVVIVALKTTANHLLPSLLEPLLASTPVVLLIQNGLCVEADLAERLPGIRLAAGLAFICSTKTGPAHVVHQDYGALTLADYNSGDPSAVERIAADFTAAGVPTSVVEYNFGRWRKAIWNLPFNGLAVTRDADTLQLLATDEPLIREIMAEVVAIARALGVDSLGQEHIDRNIADTRTMRPYHPSMKVDYDHHRPMEVYYLYTRAIAEARRLGVPCPRLQDLESRLLEMNNLKTT